MRSYKLAARQAQLLLFQVNEPVPEELPEIDPRPEMLCFRGQTFALVRHFFELSCQVGRLPSLLGRELFRSRVSHHAIPSFEEQVIFARDVELCLAKLTEDQARDHHPGWTVRLLSRRSGGDAALLPGENHAALYPGHRFSQRDPSACRSIVGEPPRSPAKAGHQPLHPGRYRTAQETAVKSHPALRT